MNKVVCLPDVSRPQPTHWKLAKEQKAGPPARRELLLTDCFQVGNIFFFFALRLAVKLEDYQPMTINSLGPQALRFHSQNGIKPLDLLCRSWEQGNCVRQFLIINISNYICVLFCISEGLWLILKIFSISLYISVK
jgi:hypothetical protein